MLAGWSVLIWSVILGTTFAGECGEFSVGECGLEEDNIVEIQTVPCTGVDTDDCVEFCQRLCSYNSACNFFSYNVDTFECVLMQEPSENAYVSTCDVVAGPDSPTLKYCLENTLQDSCDRFIPENCEYLGTVKLNMTNMQSPTKCQEALVDFASIYNVVHFVHDIDPPYQLCQLLDSDKKTCSSVAGPTEPPFVECPSKSMLRLKK